MEVKNSYVASQVFDAQRAAQENLGWDVTATLDGQRLHLTILQDGTPVRPDIQTAVFGRATHVGQDQSPVFVFDGSGFAADVEGDSEGLAGNWNLRLTAIAEDGTVFQQRIIVEVTS